MATEPLPFTRDRLELLLTTRKTYLIRLRSDLMRVEDEIAWCKRRMPDHEPVKGDEQAAELIRQLIALKEGCIADIERMLAEHPED